MYIQYIQGLCQSRLDTADHALVTSSLHCNDSLDTWTVIHMTATQFKPLIFSVSGFALSNVANIFIFLWFWITSACAVYSPFFWVQHDTNLPPTNQGQHNTDLAPTNRRRILGPRSVFKNAPFQGPARPESTAEPISAEYLRTCKV
jgi:hypothetical protein